MSAPNFYRSTIFREDNTGIAMGTEGLREDTYPHLYSWAVRPESGVTEWTIETTMYKQVQPGSGGYTHPYRRDPPFGIFDDNQ